MDTSPEGSIRARALRALAEAIALMAEAEETTEAAESTGEELLRYDTVARELGVDPSFARKLGRRGLLPEVRLGDNCVRVRRADLNEYIRRHRVNGNGRAG